MNYKKIVCDEYDIHVIKNKNFHTIDFRIFFSEDVTKEKITSRNFLVNLLPCASNNYDTKEKLLKRCQDLYSLSPSASTFRNGNLLTTKFSISTINSKYIEKDNLYDNILLLRDVILNPLVVNNEFSSRYFDIIKTELENETKTIPEEPRLYANIKLLELLNDNGAIMSSFSDIKILSKLNTKSLYQCYLDLIHNSKIDIFISGNVKNIDKIIQFIKDNFKFNNQKPKLKNVMVIHTKKDLITKKEKKDCQQSKLSIGYKAYELTDYENHCVSLVFDGLIGGGPNSLLMKYIREENSLCYYINSFFNRLDNILIVNSGINKKNYEKVVTLQREVFERIKNGQFTNKSLNEAKMEIIGELSNVFENNRSIIDYYYGRYIFSSYDINERIKLIKNVSKKDIINFTNKLHEEAIFFLKGDL